MHQIKDAALRRLLIEPDASIRQAMEHIEEGSVEIALVLDAEGRLLGTVSDGDIRRALLAGASIEGPVGPHVHRTPVTIEPGIGRAAALDLMQARRIAQVPVVDGQDRLLGLHLLHEIIGAEPRPNWAVVLAGGRGSRLGPLTAGTPKPMLEVAGRPILERMVLHLVGSGIRRIFLSVGYLGDQIEAHFQDGSDFGCQIDYLREAPDHPLGTGGPLRMLHDVDSGPQDPVLVVNGDLVTSFSVSGILGAHSARDPMITIAASEYTHDVPFGVIELLEGDDSMICSLKEKPQSSWLVNAGIYVLEPTLIARVPHRPQFPITELVTDCLDRREGVCSWLLTGDWHDVGRPGDLALARGEA